MATTGTETGTGSDLNGRQTYVSSVSGTVGYGSSVGKEVHSLILGPSHCSVGVTVVTM